MKKLILSALVILATFVTVTIFIVSCNKENQRHSQTIAANNHNSTPAHPTANPGDGKDMTLAPGCSCSIRGSNGSQCSASGAGTCNCDCDAFGDAKCNSTSGGNHAVSAVPATSGFIDGLQELLSSFNKDYATTASGYLETIQQLFEENDYIISDQNDLNAYITASDNIDAIFSRFTRSERDQINRYKTDNQVH